MATMARSLLEELLGGGGASFGNPNIQRQGAKTRALAAQRDVNTLPDPRTYAAVSGLLGTAPDEMGFSVMNPEYESIMQTARPAFATGTALGVAPVVGLAGKVGAKALGPTAAGMTERYLQRQGLMPSLDVYHGTPHTLPPTARNPLGEFDASKIGTGEGAQVYGRGIYTAEAPAVATEYAKANRGRGAAADNLLENLSPGIRVDAMRALNMKDGFIRQAMLDDLMASNPKDAKILQSINEQKAGNLYKADLPDAMIGKMLDFDKPLSQQPEILKALTPEAMGLKLRVAPESGFMGYVSPDGVPIGLQVKGATPENFRKKWLDRIAEFGEAEGGAGRVIGYLGGTSETSAAQVSAALRQAGIPGIKYLDEASRAKGEGTRNFVTFPGEEKNLRILERNGLLGTIAP